MATLALSGSAIIRAGANVGSVPITSWDDFIEAAEATLAGITKNDVVTKWGPTLSGSVVAPMMTEYCERLAAIDGIQYDMSGYTTRIEAEDMINIHWARLQEIQDLLKDEDVQNFIGV